MKVYNCTRQTFVGEIKKADSFFKRLRGLLGISPAQDPRGLWLIPCRSIHTLGMKYPLDLIFLNAELEVLSIQRSVPPFSWTGRKNAVSVLEFFSGYWDLKSIQINHKLEFRSI